MRKAALMLSLGLISIVSCGDGGNSPSGGQDGGATGTGGSGTGGSGATASGGAVTGGMPSGGNTSGGAASGGAGGDNPGGSATGGSATGGSATGGSATGGSATGGSATGGSATGGSATGGSATGGTQPQDGPPAGNPDGACSVPAAARAADTTSPDVVVGDGTPASCTSARFVAAVAQGGVITFDCGPNPVTITLTATAVVQNDVSDVIIDGGGLVTLSGGGVRRILYQNTCDRQVGWTTAQCNNQPTPRLTVQNLTFVDGNARWSPSPAPAGTPAGNHVYDRYEGGVDYLGEEGGGAIYAQGGRLKIVNTRFFNNGCADADTDIAGGAVRAFQQYNGLPVTVVNSTFGGAEGYGNSCSNGGAVGSIGVSWSIYNSVLSNNSATGCCGNGPGYTPPGGGLGGAIYNDGNEMTLSLCGTRLEHNEVTTHGSGIFFVSNNHTGTVDITDCVFNNTGGTWYPVCEQISTHDDTVITVTNTDLSCPP